MTGVVIGKFHPPHRGHKYLIETARSRVDHLTVIVCEHRSQSISGAQRAEWLTAIHPGVTVVVTPDDLPDEPEPWAIRTKEILGGAPDVVFTSEDYGEGYARELGSKHILVDRSRSVVPISATVIQQDPLKNWEFLEPEVRAYYVKRIVLTGVESTGKTTLSEELSIVLSTEWVDEFGREYTYTKTDEWVTEDFVIIAKEQQRRENEAAKRANKILICDTNAYATGVWHEFYMGFRSPEVEAIGATDKVDLNFLAIPDFPWVDDGTRDGKDRRMEMHEWFIERLADRPEPVVALAGGRETRLLTALTEIEARFGVRGRANP